jgi:hypothetical protein
MALRPLLLGIAFTIIGVQFILLATGYTGVLFHVLAILVLAAVGLSLIVRWRQTLR